MDTLNPEYNISPSAGSCLGMKLTARQRAKISTVKKKLFEDPAAREKISASCMGRETSPETRAKISAALKGNKNALGNKLTPEERAKISASLMGNTRSRDAAQRRRRLRNET
jgi:hypothetical protein